jgi:hypothetical protein
VGETPTFLAMSFNFTAITYNVLHGASPIQN